MKRAIFFFFLFSAAAGLASALDFPEIPDSARVLSVQEVKNYWVNKMPEPQEPGRLSRAYNELNAEYHRQIGERHRLIREIRAGKHDALAKVIALRHNIQAWLQRGENEKAAAARAELSQIETVADKAELLELERANAERLDRLIAATERLAAAIENNGGNIPAEELALANEIIPFEEDCDIVPALRREIITHRHHQLPIIIHPGNAVVIHPGNPGRVHPARPAVVTPSRPAIVTPARPAVVTPATPASVTPARRSPAQGGHSPRPTRNIQPQVRQPQVRPAARPQPAPRVPQQRQPQVRQPQIRPAR